MGSLLEFDDSGLLEIEQFEWMLGLDGELGH
jgi:hypothetical protein